MKNTLLIFTLLLSITALGQNTYAPIESNVYHWDNLAVAKKENMEQRQIIEGSSRHFKHIKIHATTVYPHQIPHPGHKHDEEELIIIKEGELTVTIEGKTQTLGVGSIALMMSGDEHSFENKTDENVTYYVMRYESREPKDLERAKKAGGSFCLNWNNIPFQANEKGGTRKFFDKPTAMSKRVEMHVTTLNEGLQSHPPHTHQAAEILLPIDNVTEEYINGKWIEARKGDIILLESTIPHAIRNISRGTTTYFAFQFE